jgi:hypothetical protein
MLQPDLASSQLESNTVYANAAERSRFIEGLRQAGLRH